MTTHGPEGGTLKRPFQTVADPELFFANTLYAETLGCLLSAVERGEPLAILTGEPGTGKTTILRRLMGQLERAGLRCITYSVPVGLDYLRASLPTPEPERRVAVGLDEAQALSDELLIALPALLAGRPDVRVVLVGQPGLVDKLAALEASGVTLPVSVRCQLGPLAADEVGPYIEHCWRKASDGLNPFSSSAVRRIASASAGIPQIVNLICDHALHLAKVRGLETVSADLVDEIARALRLGGPPKPLARPVRRVSPRSPARRAAIATVVAIPLLIVAAVGLLRGPPTRGREGSVETPATLRAERPSIDPPVVATQPPEPARRDSVVAGQSAPNREREPEATGPVASAPGALPPRASSLGPSVTTLRGDPAKDQALLQRSEEGDLEAVRTLLAEGASPEARDSAGLTPVMLAVIYDHSAIVELLIARGASVNAQNRAGLTPLMFAAINNHPAVLRILMDRGANMNARTKAGWTALTYAAWQGHPELVRLLLASGAEPNVTDRAGWTILQYASWRATQPDSSDDLSEILTGAEPAHSTATGSGHTEIVGLLQRTGVKRDRSPASAPDSRRPLPLEAR